MVLYLVIVGVEVMVVLCVVITLGGGGRAGGGAGTFQSRLLPGPAANQYHFPVFEAGNYEVERLCDP